MGLVIFKQFALELFHLYFITICFILMQLWALFLFVFHSVPTVSINSTGKSNLGCKLTSLCRLNIHFSTGNTRHVENQPRCDIKCGTGSQLRHHQLIHPTCDHQTRLSLVRLKCSGPITHIDRLLKNTLRLMCRVYSTFGCADFVLRVRVHYTENLRAKTTTVSTESWNWICGICCSFAVSNLLHFFSVFSSK